jgi:hypothetical protein
VSFLLLLLPLCIALLCDAAASVQKEKQCSYCCCSWYLFGVVLFPIHLQLFKGLCCLHSMGLVRLDVVAMPFPPSAAAAAIAVA